MHACTCAGGVLAYVQQSVRRVSLLLTLSLFLFDTELKRRLHTEEDRMYLLGEEKAQLVSWTGVRCGRVYSGWGCVLGRTEAVAVFVTECYDTVWQVYPSLTA